MMSPALRDLPVMNIRINTWTSSSKNASKRKTSKTKPSGKDKPLITGISKKTDKKLQEEQEFCRTGDEVEKEVTWIEKKF